MSERVIFEFEKPLYELEDQIEKLKKSGVKNKSLNVDSEVKALEKKLAKLQKDIYAKLSSWEKTQVARHPERPYTLNYIDLLFTDFVELHGDRRFSDDEAIVGGFAKLDGLKVMVIGHQKGRDLKDNIKRNYGMANPEGYRKAMRLMFLAEKFKLPIITFVDTPGAYPGLGGEERGQAEAIAYNLEKMSSLRVPTITVVIGEGGSGGALGLAVTNIILMLENSIYSVISPEGCASILWKDATKANEAANAMGITADRLYKLGIIDEIIKEPLGGAHRNYEETAENVKNAILKNLKKLRKQSSETLANNRYKKFRKMGEFFDKGKLVSSKIS